MKMIRAGFLIPFLLLTSTVIAQQTSTIRFQSDKLADGTKLQLRREWPSRKLVDSMLLRNGSGELVVTDTFPAVYSLNARKPWMSAVIFLEGGNVNVVFNGNEPVVEGSNSQKQMADFLSSMKPYEEQWRDAGNRYSAAKDMEEKLAISKEMVGPSEKVMNGREQFVLEHANNLAGIWMAFEQANLWREGSLKKLVPEFRKQARTEPLAAMLQTKLDAMMSVKMTGQKAPAFALKDIKGNTIQLDSVLQQNKYVLLDVWASWCTPCRATNRKLAPEYAALKKLGIELISVSVDEKPADWKKAVATDKIPWSQLISPEGMKSKVVADYKVQLLPATFLIDQQGNIIREHVSVEELKMIGASGDLLINNITIIDGEAAIAPRKGSLLIRDGIIRKISYEKPLKPVPTTIVMDGSGKFIAPGMTDAHVHLATLDLSDQQAARKITDSVLYNMLRHGITTVRDMAGDAPFLQTLSRDAEARNLYSPSIFYAAQFAGPGYFRMMGNGRKGQEPGGQLPWVRSITDTSNIPKAIAEAKAWGVTGIKIYAELSAALVDKITKEAHRQGLLAWGHAAVNPALPADAATSGVNSMSHANDMVFQQFPAGTDLGKVWGAIYKGLKADSATVYPVLLTMKNKRIYLDPTLFHSANNNMKNAPVIAAWAHRLGVQFVAGTDWIYPTGNEAVPLMDELRHLVSDAGLSYAEVIQAAGINGARVMGLKDRGLVREGMRADLLILNSDPLKAPEVMFSPQMVIRKGVLLSFR